LWGAFHALCQGGCLLGSGKPAPRVGSPPAAPEHCRLGQAPSRGVSLVLDRLIGDLLDFVDIRLSAGRPAISDWVGGNHPSFGDDKHRLVVDVAEDVDVVGAFNLDGLDRWPAWLSRLGLSKRWPGGEQDRSGGGRGKG